MNQNAPNTAGTFVLCRLSASSSCKPYRPSLLLQQQPWVRINKKGREGKTIQQREALKFVKQQGEATPDLVQSWSK